MPKKTERSGKLDKAPKGDRWTVRGVSAKLQKAAGDAARARGLTLGQWLSEVLTTALPQRARGSAEAAEAWEMAIERRVARLEAAMLDPNAANTERASAAARPG